MYGGRLVQEIGKEDGFFALVLRWFDLGKE